MNANSRTADTRRRSWTAIKAGCRIVLYGDMREVATFEEARAIAGAVRVAVLAVVPEARFMFNPTPKSYLILATVDEDALCVFAYGPAHRKAIRQVRAAASRAADAAQWLESEKTS